MLLEFSVKNYASFKDLATFTLIPGKGVRSPRGTTDFNIEKVSSKQKALRSAVIFGPNAAGKSNLLDAISTLKMLVIQPTQSVSDKLNCDSFGNSTQPISFKITFIRRKVIFDYSLSFTAKEFIQEKLLADDEVVFDRDMDVPEDLRANQTLLFYYQGKNKQEAAEAFKWFAEDLVPFTRVARLNTNPLLDTLNDESIKKKFLEVMKYVDFGITDISVSKPVIPSQLADIIEQLKVPADARENFISSLSPRTVLVRHLDQENKSYNLVLGQESAGTQEAISLVLSLITFDSDKTLLFDEFDRSYHFDLARTFLALINCGKQHNQYILSSHQPALMDDKSLRKDQIWFVEKNAFGVSSLYSLYDFSQTDSRGDVSLSKKYLAGRFGALPEINEPALLNIFGGDSDE